MMTLTKIDLYKDLSDLVVLLEPPYVLTPYLSTIVVPEFFTTIVYASNNPTSYELLNYTSAITVDNTGTFTGFLTAGLYDINYLVKNAAGETAYALTLSTYHVILNQTITFASLPDVPAGPINVLLSASSSSGLPITYAISGPAILFTDYILLTGVGIVSITASQQGNANYHPAVPVTRTFNSIRQSQTISQFETIPPLFAGATYTLTAPPTASSNYIVDITVKSGPATISGNTITITGNGTPVVLAANQPGNIFYEPALEVTTTVGVSKQSQTISAFETFPNLTIFEQYTLTPPTASSGLPVAITVKSGPATISGDVIIVTGSGTIVLAANQPGNAIYNPATEVTATIVANKLDQTISAFIGVPSSVYEGQTFTVPWPVASSGNQVTITANLGSATFDRELINPNTYNQLNVTPTSAGILRLAANSAADLVFNAAPEVLSNSITVLGKIAQTISAFENITNKNVGDVFTLTAPPTASSGLPVTITLKSGPATISGNTVTVTGAGIVVLAANQSGNVMYQAAPEVTISIAATGWTITDGGPDPYWDNVSLLLHGDGIGATPNDQQNDTFLDSSTNNFTITRTGTPTQGSFSPYALNGVAYSPAVHGGGGYFDGSGDYLDAPSNAAFQFGTAPFTIELWAYFNLHKTYIELIDFRNNVPTSVTPVLYTTSTGSLRYFVNSSDRIVSSSDLPLNTWVHIVLSKSGTETKMFVNGIQSGSTYTDNNTYILSPCRIGSNNNGTPSDSTNFSMNGYISNVRVVKGAALYTSNFTPPTSPVTLTSNGGATPSTAPTSGQVSLLCDFTNAGIYDSTTKNNTFLDSSTNNFTITRTGTPTQGSFSPYALNGVAYSPTLHGGSAYFNGTTDYLSLPYNSSFDFSSGAFTAECWVYLNTVAAEMPIVSNLTTTSSGWSLFFWPGPGSRFGAAFTGNAADITGTSTIQAKKWYHVAVSGNTGSYKLFVNGVQEGATYTGATTLAGGVVNIGNYPLHAFRMNGYISNLRVTNGVAIYTANFTPPISPVTTISNSGATPSTAPTLNSVSLLCDFTNAGIYDSTTKNDILITGNVKPSTAQTKYGSSSLYFDGNGDKLTIPSSSNFEFGTKDFTIECWVYCTNLAGGNIGVMEIVDFRTFALIETRPTLAISGNSFIYFTSGGIKIQSGTILANTWYHVAVSRTSGVTDMFVNGTKVGANYSDVNNYLISSVTVGAYIVAGWDFTGYIDDLRITKGIARYTSAFTPPTIAFPDIPNL